MQITQSHSRPAQPAIQAPQSGQNKLVSPSRAAKTERGIKFGANYSRALSPKRDSRPPEAVLAALQGDMDSVAPCYALTQSGGRIFGIKRGKKPVTGERTENTLNVMRWLKINNPHTPILEVTVSPDGTGSQVSARFKRLPSVEKWMNRLWPLSLPIDVLGKWLAKWDEAPLESWLNDHLRPPQTI